MSRDFVEKIKRIGRVGKVGNLSIKARIRRIKRILRAEASAEETPAKQIHNVDAPKPTPGVDLFNKPEATRAQWEHLLGTSLHDHDE